MNLEAALAEALVFGELQPALDLIAELTRAEDAGAFRFPRYFVGELGEAVLKSGVPAGCEVLRLDSAPMGERGAAGIVVRGCKDTAALQACLAPLQAAHRRIQRFEALLGQNTGLMALIEQRLGACAALASSKGDLMWTSQSARDVLGQDAHAMLQERVRQGLRDIADNPDKREFLLKQEGQAHIFGTMSFVRETPGASIHYVAIELHGHGVDAASDEAKLTKSEREVYRLLVQGLSNEEMGKQRFVSVETIRTHVKAILRKLNVSSRLELVTRHSRRP